MTAPLPPNADELVSAYVDGAAAPDEVAIVEASPELMARVEALQEVAGFLAGPVTPPGETTREQHLAAALGEFDRLFAAGEFDAATSEVVDEAPAPTLLQAVPDPAPSEVAAAHAVTSREQDWLDAKINADGKIDEFEQALLDFLAEE